MNLCALCIVATSNAAARVIYVDGKSATPIHERSDQFAALAQRIMDGDHPLLPPGGHFVINTLRTTALPVTTVHGTEVCAAHVYDAFEQARVGRVR